MYHRPVVPPRRFIAAPAISPPRYIAAALYRRPTVSPLRHYDIAAPLHILMTDLFD
jgi:hypothetical protein